MDWLRTFEIFMQACNDGREEDKCAKFLHFTGPKVQQIYATLTDPPSDDAAEEIMFGPLAQGYMNAPP